MFWKRMRWVAQVVGLATILGLSVVGVLALTGNSDSLSMALGPASLHRVPNVINYQGMLREPDGTPVSGAYTMTFRLYDDPVGSTVLFSETLTRVMVHDGLFTVLLGDSTGNPMYAALFKQPLYVGLQIEDNPEMAPRQRIAPVPYAVQLTDGIYVAGDGDVGVGTTEPQALLHVQGPWQEKKAHARIQDDQGNGIDITGWRDGVNLDPVQADDGIFFGADTDLSLLQVKSGTVRVEEDIDIKRHYQAFWVGSWGAPEQKPLGQWDLCALASYQIAGRLYDDNDWGMCRVGPTWMGGWDDSSLVAKPPGGRDDWTLSANVNSDVDNVLCQAICFRLGE